MTQHTATVRQQLLMRRREVSRRIQELLRQPESADGQTVTDAFALRDLLAEQDELKRDLSGAGK